MMQKLFAIFDRDGTVIVERNYLSEPHEVELIPGAAEGLRELRKIGLGLLVVTNQSGVGRGYFDEVKLAAIHEQLTNLLAAQGVILDGIYYCPHKPEDGCRCRKPQPRLVELAAAEHGFDPGLSFVIGDKPCDIDLGRSVGATTILVGTGYGRQVAADGLTSPDHVANDVRHAARIIGRLVSSNGSGVAHAID